MNTNPAMVLLSEILDANTEHPPGGVDLAVDLPGEHTDAQAESAAADTLTIGHGQYCSFVPTQLGDKDTAGGEPQYTLARMDLAVLD
ncbi:hypothetical protein, partial [Streptomyces sp. NPDC048224]|uniref:hypothetical protein n=1 Tax=Streptomyces sp. NPDC048224 TaxID=3154500 RepID=UPI0033F4BB02